MNLAFYVDKTSDTDLNKKIFNLLNDAVDKKLVNDACIFYNEVDFNPISKKFGSFNSTDMWFYSGTLVVTALNLLPMAMKVINKINLVYLYDKPKINDASQLMGMMSLFKSIKVCTDNEDNKKEFYRLTGKEIPVIKTFSAEEILGV